MNNVVYRIGLDVEEIGSQVYLAVKQGDTSRELNVFLTQGHEPYAIEDGCIAVFAATKADGTVLLNDCEIDGNNIIYPFTEQTVSAIGKMKCEIRIYKDGDVLFAPNFTISVQASALDDASIASRDEVNVLAGLISEADSLITEVNKDLADGAFVPQLSVGEVTTLPAGASAEVTISGSGEAPVLNFGIPQGEQGQAEGLIPDTVLSPNSTKPVQNKVLDAEFKAVRKDMENLASELDKSLENLEENKVGKETGKGLSSNDFTDAEKQKLAGIEAGANKYVLENGDVTEEKIAANAVTQQFQFALPHTGWVDKNNGTYTNTVTIPGIRQEWNGIIYARRGTSTGGGADNFALTAAAFELDREQIDKLLACYISADNTLFLYASEPITRKTDMLLEVYKR